MREARAAAALQHPAVVQVYDVVHENGRPWIVMELLDARSLADMVNGVLALTLLIGARLIYSMLRVAVRTRRRRSRHRMLVDLLDPRSLRAFPRERTESRDRVFVPLEDGFDRARVAVEDGAGVGRDAVRRGVEVRQRRPRRRVG